MGLDRLFRRKRSNLELEEEIQAHLAMAMREGIERGEDPQAAALAARRDFGNRSLIQETTREMWGCTALTTLWQDVRYALRGMSPMETFAVRVDVRRYRGATSIIARIGLWISW